MVQAAGAEHGANFIMPFLKLLAVLAIAASWLLPAQAAAEPAGVKRTPKAAAQKMTVRPNKKPNRRWTGYGFLPGYRQPPALSEWRDRSVKHRGLYPRTGPRYEQRYVRYYGYGGYGQLQYGWGEPGTYRGRWNGGSFGPCWTQTPIGMVWNCGN